MRHTYATDMSGAFGEYLFNAAFGVVITALALLLSDRKSGWRWRRHALWLVAVPAALLAFVGGLSVQLIFPGSPIWFDLLIVFFFLPGALVARALFRG